MKLRTDLGLVAVLTLLAFVVAELLPPSLALLRAPLALPLVLALPGYAVATAVFLPDELRPGELALLSIAISVAATILAALVLDGLGVGLSTVAWMGLLAALTLVAAAQGIARGHARMLRVPRFTLPRAEIAALTLAAVLLFAAAALGFSPLAAPKSTRGTSALWIVPAPGGANAACVGVINEELRVTTYTVTVSTPGVAERRFGPITLASGATWRRLVGVGSGKPVVTASLSKAADPSAVYRTAWLRNWGVRAVSC